MSDYGEICDRCRKANPGLAWNKDLKMILCAACLHSWQVLKKHSSWGSE